MNNVPEMSQADCDRIDMLLRDHEAGLLIAAEPLAKAMSVHSHWVVEMVAIGIHFLRMRAAASDNSEMLTREGQRIAELIADAFAESLERGPLGEAVRDNMEEIREAAVRSAARSHDERSRREDPAL